MGEKWEVKSGVRKKRGVLENGEWVGKKVEVE